MPELTTLWSNFKYFPHQVEAVNWMIAKERDGTTFEDTVLHGGLLADDMGLGKTIEISGLIRNNPVENTLLVVPASLLAQWNSVLERAEFTVYQFKKGNWFRSIDFPGEPAVYLLNYEKLYTSAFSAVTTTTFDRIILDEAHRVRSYTGSAAVVCNAIKAKFRWAVTGTPIVNSLKDVVALYRFIGIKRPNSHWEPELEELSRRIVLRRSIDDMRGVIADVPPEPVFHEIKLDFETPEEEEFYRGIQGQVQGMLYANDTPSSVILGLLRLRQISVHPQVYIESKKKEFPEYNRPDWNLPVTKFEAVRRLLLSEKADANVPKYIFICHFKEEINLLRKYLKENELVNHVFTYDGSQDKKKQALTLALARKTTTSTALLIQIQAGGVGLNLQEFNRVIFLSSWWTSALMSQAVARACRIGQRQTVHVYNFVLNEEKTTNIDRKILDSVRVKKDIQDRFFMGCSQ
jgi:SNF2 family DNA or RNA helicase